MYIEKFIIFDYQNKEANSFEFAEGTNIICSHDNASGKSSLLKSIYFALGLDLDNFAQDWHHKKMIFKIYYNHNSIRGYIIRSENNFWVNDHKNNLDLKGYSSWLTKLLDIKMKLPLKFKEKMQDVYASVPLSLFYIDQDTSWSGALYKNTVNLKWYKPSSIPKDILEYFLDISNDSIVNLKDQKTKLNEKEKILNNQGNVLTDLQEDFILDSIDTTFDEHSVKKEINEYLQLATSLGNRIKKHKSSIYSKRIKLDAILLEINEISEIIKYLDNTYKEIKHKCTKCNTQLTAEQSILRMKLDDNKISIQMRKTSLEENSLKLKKEIDNELNHKFNLDKEYTQLLSVAETKQGELTLGRYIHEKAKENTKSIYCDIKNKLIIEIKQITDNITEINKKIKELQKNVASKKELLEKDFNQILFSAKTMFPKANLEHKFLDFKEIKDSGAIKNQVFLCLYMCYTKIILDNTRINLPFGLDSIVHDEWDEDTYSSAYKLVENILLSNTTNQTFFAMLDDKSIYIRNNYNKIFLNKDTKLLNEEKYTELKNEFDIITEL